ncbi:MAG: response regulator [Proteobacteria bacterium]|nr:response regulator [Pseudomonadota bacterium]
MDARNQAAAPREAPAKPTANVFAAAGGEMATLIAETDWSALPIGPEAAWPQSLTTSLRILVTSRYAMWMAWGADLTMFYNDAYAPTLGVKHPWALGKPADQVWSEIWPDIGPRITKVMQTGSATWDEGLLLFLERSGYPEETYHTFSYSPLPDDDGSVGGMLCVVTEDTVRVVGERRLATLRDLGSQLASASTESDVCVAVEHALARNARDLPFSIVYLREPGSNRLRRVCQTGGVDDGLAPRHVDDAAGLPWPAADILGGTATCIVHDVRGGGGLLPCGDWDRPPERVAIVPIPAQGQEPPVGLLIAGLNPYRPFQEAYAGFIDLVAAQIAGGLASAGAYEAERRRAEALAEVDRAKTVFFSNVSHEFRTPLTLMLGPLEEEIAALSKHRAGQEVAARLAVVQLNGLRLLRLVNTLLDFSRIEAGRMDARFYPVDLSQVTADLASTFRSACDRAGLVLTVACPPLPQPVYVDTDMWERIVLNLLSNAFKFTLKGGIIVRVEAVGEAAEFSVQDTGVGIPVHELPHLFDRFHRIKGQRGRTLEGTGIGLALVNELVQLHRGTIRVESAVDVGTTVTLRMSFGRAHLPERNVSETDSPNDVGGIAAAAFVQEAMRWLPEADDGATVMLDGVAVATPDMLTMAPPVAGGITQQRRIVLADDNADMRGYVSRLLRSANYEVVTVRDGAEALKAVRENPPDLVLSDIMMPHLDGFGLLAAIREDAAVADLPVILLSARAGEEARVEGLDAGADDYLMKPFSARELLARIRSNLELARLRRQARDALRDANERLEQRVIEEVARRTAAEDAARQSQKMEAIGHLTGGVAHDFNNLLTIIGGGIETLQRTLSTIPLGADEPRVNRSVAMIVRGAERAATLTHRLLAFARRQALNPRPMDANRLVAGVSELLRRTLGEAIALETVLAGDLWRTLADANQLENALLNLAVNARDAMPEGGRLTVETANSYLSDEYAAAHQDVRAGQYVMIAVSDTGCGMDKATLDQVFEPFFTTKDAGHGTGLGLSQVYGFIKQSQGHIKLYSEVGHGTVAKLYLPRLIGAAAEPEAPELEPAAPLGRGETILVVEDETVVREYSVQSLRELGYRTHAVGNGPAALRVLRRDSSIVLLFTDIGLPGGMTGRQLADAALALRPNLKVLYTTGYARNAIVHGGTLDAGAQLLPKPFSFSALAARVRAVLDA